jgi:signal transduction histidine kinase/CheY-like chemotaxis protein
VEVGHAAPGVLAEPARRVLGIQKRIKVEVDCNGIVFQFSVVPAGAEVNLYAQDITALRVAEDALRVEARRKTEFLAVLSHELRTPLASVRNSIAVLDRAPPDSGTARRAGEILHRQSDHLTRLVDDLLDISRIAHGKIELRRSHIDARSIVRRTCEDAKDAFEERGVELYGAEPAHPIWIDADAARMVQMVGNLLNNALKFTPPGGQVHVSVRKRGVTCEVSVRDNGVGVDPDDLDSIFDPFVQAERTHHGARGGLGIGLALVRELAISHGGRVRALSDGPGRGTEILLTLPLSLNQGDEGPTAGAATVQPRAPGLSILLVEDNEDARESLALLLTLSGHDVNVVTTGRAGVEAVSAHHPDVLICDVGLPDLSGFEVIRAIRAEHPASGLFAIALTGYAQPQDRDQAFKAGFDAHLAKPPDFAQLDQILFEVARRKIRPSGA